MTHTHTAVIGLDVSYAPLTGQDGAADGQRGEGRHLHLCRQPVGSEQLPEGLHSLQQRFHTGAHDATTVHTRNRSVDESRLCVCVCVFLPSQGRWTSVT